MSVSDNFKTFLDSLKIEQEKRQSISYRYKRITKALNLNFYNDDSDQYHSRYVGSYGRQTATSAFSDLDMLFQLPYSVYKRICEHECNGQSDLLQEFRNAIQGTYRSTHIGADGQVVAINFDDHIIFEIVPVFENKDGSFTYPDSNNGGSWKVTNPLPEIEAVGVIDQLVCGNLKNLCKMTRAWRDEWNVPISGILIDTLAVTFISDWKYKKESFTYYDWMTRDFFKFLANQDTSQNYWLAVGSNQKVYRKGPFEYKAKQCYNIAIEACDDYSSNHFYTAQQKMRKIYGTSYPNQ